MFFSGSIIAIVGLKIYMETQQSQETPQLIPPNSHPSNITLPFCYHNGTCSTAPRDYSQP